MSDLDPFRRLSGADANLAAPPVVGPAELAAALAARMCHDFISPASAIVSGIDLLDDPSAEDMRDDAMTLIAASAKKLVSHLAFARVAFGASASAESFDVGELRKLTQGVFDHVRPDLDWRVAASILDKAASRALLNLAQIGASALPMGGTATVTAEVRDGWTLMAVEAVGGRVRLRDEVAGGLRGEALGEGLLGHWVQAYYLSALLAEAGGHVDAQAADGRVSFRARTPIHPQS